MGFKKYFRQTVRLRYPTQFRTICAETEIRYKTIAQDVKFASTSSNPVDRRLDFTAYFLALIQVLETRSEPFGKIREICLEITHEYVRPKNRWQAWLKRLPVRIIGTPLGSLLINFMKKKTTKLGHPDGFQVEILTDPAQTYGLGYGLNIVQCGICKLFQKHDALRYASILCEVDKMTSALAGLELVRSGTIANGAKCCDFRWKKLGH